MMDFIERLKAKPEHVRRRIAVGTAAGITGVVTAAWFFTLLFAGTLSLAIPDGGVNSGTLAQANTTNGSGTSGTDNNGANLAAVNASTADVPQQSNLARLLAAVGISTAPAPKPALKVEDLSATSSAQQASPTVIPF